MRSIRGESKRNWRKLVDFVYVGGRAAYATGAASARDPQRAKMLKEFDDMPHANERDAAKGRRRYCDAGALDAYARNTTIGGRSSRASRSRHRTSASA